MSEYWKDCPFCGRHGINLHMKVMQDTEGRAWAECWGCHAQGPVIYTKPGMTSDMLITLAQGAWNARGREDKLLRADGASRRLHKAALKRQHRRV